MSFLAGLLGLPGVMQVDVEVEKGLLAERDVKNLAVMEGLLKRPGMEGTKDHFLAVVPIRRAGAFLTSVLDGFRNLN